MPELPQKLGVDLDFPAHRRYASMADLAAAMLAETPAGIFTPCVTHLLTLFS